MKIINNKLNTSDHLALRTSVKVNRGQKSSVAIEQKTENYKKHINLNWRNMKSVEKFEFAVNENLKKIKINNAFNEENEAKTRIDEYYNNLTGAFVGAEEKITNELYENNSNSKSWWTREMTALKKELQKARKEARLWNDETSIENMKKAKRNFRKEQRRCVFIYEEKKNRKIENLFDKPSKEDFWKAVDNFKNCSKDTDINEANSNVLKNNIRELFKLNSEKIENDQEKTEIEENVKKYEMNAKQNVKKESKEYINSSTIKYIIKEMKTSNTRGIDGMNNNMVKYANSELIHYKISLLINAILCTGYTPKKLNRTIIVPIIKDKNKKEFDKDNFRPISISNVLAQILEKVILLKCKILFKSDDLQFGFKKNMSTLHPLFLMKELINTHMDDKEPLYIASYDSEKAYDSVWRDGIYFKLINVISSQFWLLIKEYYGKSDGILKINGVLGDEIIEITRGVKQGGVLSPQLFNFFINELFEKIQNLGIGCKIENVKIPIMGFCDDTVLMATLISQLKILIEECEKYSKKWLLKYNVKKSVIINCSGNITKDEDINIKMNEVRIPVVAACKYLGLIINNSNDDNIHIIQKFGKVQQRYFSLSSFGIKPPGIKPACKSFLFNTFCKPIGTYGMGVMKLKSNTLQQMNIIQNNIMRYSLGLPYRTHITMLMKSLEIIDCETSFLMEKCTTIKLLHRHDLCKKILIKNINQNNTAWWFYKEIQTISDKLHIEPEVVCYYPDRTRKDLEDAYYGGGDNVRETVNEIQMLLDNYNFRNRRKLIELIKFNYN